MLLADWRKRTGKTQTDVGADLGRDQVTIWRWENGKRRPRERDMEAILRLTKGAVTPNDFYLSAQPGPAPETSAAAVAPATHASRDAAAPDSPHARTAA